MNSDDEKKARIAALYREWWFGYTAVTDIRSHVEDLLTRPVTEGLAGCSIVSRSHNGKTTFLKHMVRRHNKQPIAGEQISSMTPPQMRVLFMQTPPLPTEERLIEGLMSTLQLSGSAREPPDRKIRRIKAVFAALGVQLLEIDEVGFFQAGSQRQLVAALNALKFLANHLKVWIVLATVEKGLTILAQNEEILNRFPPKFLPSWQINSAESESLMVSIEDRIKLRESSNLGDTDLTNRIVIEGNNTLGHIVDLCRLLARNAIATGKERIELADLTPTSLQKLGWVHPSKRKERPN
jgi:hypothetical protein